MACELDNHGDPVKYVERWLGRQGYPLEYEVARLLRAEGVTDVEQGRYWRDTDPKTGERKGRELDVVASLRGSRTIAQFVVECKHIHRPWVIFEHEDGRAGGFDVTVERLMAGKPARQHLARWYRDGRRPWHLKPAAAFKVVESRDEDGKRIGDPAYEVVRDLIRGAWALHQETPKAMNAVTLPVLVVEGDLVTLTYDSRGHRQIAPTDFERVTWAGAVLPGPGDYERPDPVTFDILTRRMVENWATDASRSLRDIFETLESRQAN